MALRRIRTTAQRSALIVLASGLGLLPFSCQARQSGSTPSKPTASFSYSPSSPVAGETIQFTDTSTGHPTSWQWAFGDGSTSTTENPSHAFASEAVFGVTLTVGNASGTSSVSHSVTVGEAPAGYYVDANDASASDANPGTASSPWKTIGKANQTLRAGDTVYIKAGTYTDCLAPKNSGSASDPITYRAYGSDVVTIQNASCGVLLDGKSYITVQGIAFYNLDRFMYLENGANYNVIAQCTFNQMRNYADWAGSRIINQSQHNWIHGCTFSRYGACVGTPGSGTSSGVVMDIGNEDSMTGSSGAPDYSSYNLIENNTMFYGGHHVLGVNSQYNVIRNNYLHNEGWSQGRGQRVLYAAGYAVDSGRNLIEGNRIAYSAVGCNGNLTEGAQISTSHNIIRGNIFYFNNLPGLMFSVSSSYYQDANYNHVYNNTFFYNDQTSESDPGKSAIYCGRWSGSWVIKYNAFKNNLYYGHPSQYSFYGGASASDQIYANEFNGDVSGDPKFANATATLGDPMDDTYPDFHLTAASPCLDKGGALTTITSSSGSGTTLTVADAEYFMDGWGISGVDGDLIQIVGTSQTARIRKVDYSANTITVDTTLTWTQNQGLALAYVGSAPDAGAFEHGNSALHASGVTGRLFHLARHAVPMPLVLGADGVGLPFRDFVKALASR